MVEVLEFDLLLRIECCGLGTLSLSESVVLMDDEKEGRGADNCEGVGEGGGGGKGLVGAVALAPLRLAAMSDFKTRLRQRTQYASCSSWWEKAESGPGRALAGESRFGVRGEGK